MTRKTVRLAAVAAILVTPLASVQAADWNYGAGSVKDYGSAAVPVPAPAPVPVYRPEWYFRADFGLGLTGGPDAEERGYYYADDAATGGRRIIPADWVNGDFETLATWGIGVGRYWSSHFRTDLTAETRSQGKVKIDARDVYTARNGSRMDTRIDDESTLRGGLFLVNGYYDLPQAKWRGFTPYIGAGLGFAWTELKRNHGTIVNECSPACTRRETIREQEKQHEISFAAQVTTGMTYTFSEYVELDVNYRYLYLGGSDIQVGINSRSVGGTSIIEVDDIHEHQLRAGLRFNVN